MIIDADCHISSKKFISIALTGDELVAQMDRAGIDRAVVWLAPPYTKDINPENRSIYQNMQKYPDRLIGFGWANPRLGKRATDRAIRQCFEEYGFYGIKFNGAQDEYVIDDPVLVLPHIELAASYGKPIAFHIGADYYENTHPTRLGNIAGNFPEIHFLMVHMGGAGLPTLERSAIEVACQHDNITLVASGIPETAIWRALRILGPGRICFGSDTPFRMMHVQLAMIQALLRDENEMDRRLILGVNIAKLVNLPI